MTHRLKDHYVFDDSLTQYGDGVFETMLGVADRIFHWDYHWQRLQDSCRRLAITLPQRGVLEKQLYTELARHGNAYSVVKMIVSRGAGLRGYRSHAKQPCYVQFSLSPYQFSPALYQGLRVRICQTRLSHQPLLAGMKHLNRLEYLMARREAADKQFDEGLLLNYDNDLIEGLTSNVFIIKDNHIFTPDVGGSGVAGTMRAYLLDFLPTLGYNVGVKRLNFTHVIEADEVFLTNATAGIMPITHVANVGDTEPSVTDNPSNNEGYHFPHTQTDSIRRQVMHPCSEK